MNDRNNGHLIKTIFISKDLALFIIIIVSLISKIFLNCMLPSKYLYDSTTIINFSNGINFLAADKSYAFTANFYEPLVYLFSINNAITGSIIIGILCNTLMIVFFMVKFPKKIYLTDFILFSACIFLLNIYVFNISKDLIQLIINIIIMLIILKLRDKSNLFVTIILITFGYFFRSYLFVVAIIYLYLQFFTKKIKSKISFSILTIFFFFSLTFLLYNTNLELFNNIFNTRDTINNFREGSIDANTIINPIIKKSGYIYTILNYFINFIRMIFPLELLIKGNILYFIFFIFIFHLLILIFRNKNKVFSDKNLESIFFVFLSYIFTFVLFEPDFGPYLRHLVPICSIFLFFILCNNEGIKNEY